MPFERYFDNYKLIQEVEKRRALYDSTAEDYNNRDEKKRLWEEVAESIIANWDELNEDEKNEIVRDVNNKWKNIRDNFRKEVRIQSSASSENSKRKRKYIYYDQMVFLIPTLQEGKPRHILNIPEEMLQNKERIIDVESVEQPKPTRASNSKMVRIEKRKNSEDMVQATKVVETVKVSREDPIDEDRSFLLSLLPTFKNFSTEQRLIAKMEFLKVIQSIMFSEDDTGSPQKSGKRLKSGRNVSK